MSQARHSLGRHSLGQGSGRSDRKNLLVLVLIAAALAFGCLVDDIMSPGKRGSAARRNKIKIVPEAARASAIAATKDTLEAQLMHGLVGLVVVGSMLVACGSSVVIMTQLSRRRSMVRTSLGGAASPAHSRASLGSQSRLSWVSTADSLASEATAHADCEHQAVGKANEPAGLGLVAKAKLALRVSNVGLSEADATPDLSARQESTSVRRRAHPMHSGRRSADRNNAAATQRPIAQGAAGVRAAVKAIEEAMAATRSGPTRQLSGTAASRTPRAPRKLAAGQVSPYSMQRSTTTGAGVTRPPTDEEMNAAGMAITADWRACSAPSGGKHRASAPGMGMDCPWRP